MARLSDDERAELQRRLDDDKRESAAEADAFEVEWWTEGADGTRRGGRMPWAQGKKIYGTLFPDLFADKPENKPEDKPDPAPGEDPGKGTTRFGRRVS